MEGEERRGGGVGAERGGIRVEGKANSSVITLPSAWWGAQIVRLPKDNVCDCVCAKQKRGSAVSSLGCQSNNCFATP